MRCPTCGKAFDPQQSPALPFCSTRCRQIDLGRWLGEQYGLPVVPDPEADEPPPDSPPEDESNGEAT